MNYRRLLGRKSASNTAKPPVSISTLPIDVWEEIIEQAIVIVGQEGDIFDAKRTTLGQRLRISLRTRRTLTLVSKFFFNLSHRFLFEVILLSSLRQIRTLFRLLTKSPAHRAVVSRRTKRFHLDIVHTTDIRTSKVEVDNGSFLLSAFSTEPDDLDGQVKYIITCCENAVHQTLDFTFLSELISRKNRLEAPFPPPYRHLLWASPRLQTLGLMHCRVGYRFQRDAAQLANVHTLFVSYAAISLFDFENFELPALQALIFDFVPDVGQDYERDWNIATSVLRRHGASLRSLCIRDRLPQQPRHTEVVPGRFIKIAAYCRTLEDLVLGYQAVLSNNDERPFERLQRLGLHGREGKQHPDDREWMMLLDIIGGVAGRLLFPSVRIVRLMDVVILQTFRVHKLRINENLQRCMALNIGFQDAEGRSIV